ncbi:hypothetical protein ACLMJK_007254 [Lecanora helva]
MSERAAIIPASLSFLAIYNPSLSKSDETLEDQILYYYSKASSNQDETRKTDNGGDSDRIREEKGEKLRQIGLAQGMSVDLTRLPGSSGTSGNDQSHSPAPRVEYSAREISPPALLLQQVLRAHQVFLLHQAPSIANLYARVARTKFCSLLKRFWDDFIWNWDVLLHGNPAVDIFNGLKLAAGGELGIGVGEEEWGSGEREVLEGFIGRTEGLVDLVVSRVCEVFPAKGDLPSKPTSESQRLDLRTQDTGGYPSPPDGVVFSGIGALTRSSVRDVSSWMEWLHRYGKETYGVRNNPSSALRQTRKKRSPVTFGNPDKTLNAQRHPSQTVRSQGNGYPTKTEVVHDGPGIPPSIVTVDKTRDSASARSASVARSTSGTGNQLGKDTTPDDPVSGTETFVKYLTLGVYGSAWGIPSGRPPVNDRVSSLRKDITQEPDRKASSDKSKYADNLNASKGYFLVGLQGELEEDVQVKTAEPEETDVENSSERNDSNSRVLMRTLHVERVKPKPSDPGDKSSVSQSQAPNTYHDRLRVVVYIHPPFIFTFLFELQTDSLSIPSFYRSLHHQLGPLQTPLLNSTSPAKVSQRLWEAASPKSTTACTTSNQPISDLVYDPIRLTVHTSIPNIPDPGTPAPPSSQSSSTSPSWTRIEALNVHSQILNTYTSTRRHSSDLERTCKTSRGYWVVWMRLPYSAQEREQYSALTNTDPGIATNEKPNTPYREAFLIRKASDYAAPAASARKASSGRFGRNVSGASSGGGDGSGWGSPGKLAEGIGIDARQYIEGLLSLNR